MRPFVPLRTQSKKRATRAAALVSGAVGTELRPVAAALEVAVRTGAPVAAVLDRARNDVADRMGIARDLAAAVSGARASAALLAVLPVLSASPWALD